MDDQGCAVVQEALLRQMDLGWIQDCRKKDCYQVNMVLIFDIRLLNTSLVGLHAKQVRLGFLTSHNYQDCKDCSKGNQGCSLVQRNLQHLMDHWWLPIYQDEDTQKISMIDENPTRHQSCDVRLMETDLVKLHCIQSGYGRVPPHNYERCRICSENSQGCYLVRAALQN